MNDMSALIKRFDLLGKTALITGASGGLGERFARCLSGIGTRVLLTARRFDKIQSLADELGNAVALKMDVTDSTSVKSVFDQLATTEEKIDICINNAGIIKTTPIFDSDEYNDFENILQTNILGVWHVTRATVRHMRHHSIPGSIINIGSINGDASPAVAATSYNISKAAVLHMTKSLVAELSPYNIRINAINPGYFPTQDAETNQSLEDQIIKKVPLRFIPNLEDLDGMILYLASNNASRYVTGACFTIDGGMSWGKTSPSHIEN